MKNLFKLLGIIALVAAIGFSMAACDTGSNTTSGGGFNGTWVSTVGGVTSIMVLNNGNVTILSDGTERSRGTYTTSGSDMTMTITEVIGSSFEQLAALMETSISEMGISPSQWYPIQVEKEIWIQYFVYSGGWDDESATEFVEELFAVSSTVIYTLSGDTLTGTGYFYGETITVTYTRQ